MNSVLILNYNDYETSVILINKIKNYEAIDLILVVDNDSNDLSYKILKEFECAKIRVIKSEKNGGYGYGNNFGIKYLYNTYQIDYILIANPDIEFSEETYLALLNLMKNEKDCAISAPLMLTPNGDVENLCAWPISNMLDFIFSSSILLNSRYKFCEYPKEYFSNKIVCQVDCVAGSMLMVNAEIMYNYGMYDEEIFLYYEETVLGFKFKSNNFKTLLLLDHSFKHWHSVSIDKSIKSKKKKRQLLLDSKLVVLRKYYKLSQIKFTIIGIFYKILIFESVLITFFKKVFRLNKKIT